MSNKSSTFFSQSIDSREKNNDVNPRSKLRSFEKVLDKKKIFIGLVLAISFSLIILYKSPEKKFPPFKKATEFFPPTITIQEVFDNNDSWIATLSAEHVRILTATGDIIPARSVNNNVAIKNDPLWPYEKVAPVMQKLKTDITFVNLETPLLNDCKPTVEGMVFCGRSDNVKGLKAINTTIASIANNHAGNFGEDGVKETINLLKENNILVTGINGAVYKKIRGVNFAFLGYNDITKDQPGVEDVNEQIIKTEISEARIHADIVIVAFHFGAEYQAQPDQRQIQLAHLAIERGADVVIGNHPHWIQPVEIYKGKFITYAHGNFVFDQMWSEKTKTGVVGRYVFYDKELIDVTFLPVKIEDFGQPYFHEGVEKEKVLREMRTESEKLAEK